MYISNAEKTHPELEEHHTIHQISDSSPTATGLGAEAGAELWYYFGNMFVTENNDGYVVVDDVDGTMQQEV